MLPALFGLSTMTNCSAYIIIVNHFVIYVNKDGDLIQSFMKLKMVHDATAADRQNYTIAEIMGTTQVVVGFGADGTSVNMGIRKGIAVRLQDKHLWLLPIHCFNHSLELAINYTLSTTLSLCCITSIMQVVKSKVKCTSYSKMASRNLDTLMFSHMAHTKKWT